MFIIIRRFSKFSIFVMFENFNLAEQSKYLFWLSENGEMLSMSSQKLLNTFKNGHFVFFSSSFFKYGCKHWHISLTRDWFFTGTFWSILNFVLIWNRRWLHSRDIDLNRTLQGIAFKSSENGQFLALIRIYLLSQYWSCIYNYNIHGYS